MHQHLADGKTAYMYPRVQYRVASGIPKLVAVGEDGMLAVAEATKGLGFLDLDREKYGVNFVQCCKQSVDLCESATALHYRFASPWLALNQANFKVFQSSIAKDKDLLLERILIGNVLSTCRSLDVLVMDRLTCEFSFRPQPVFVKGQKMIGFVGCFSVNFKIPNTISLGHLVSIGYGQVALNQWSNVTDE